MTGRDPVTWDDLRAALHAACGTVGGFFETLDAATFTAAPPGRWSPAQHLDHLIRSNAPVATGLRVARHPLPRLAARLGLARGRLEPAAAGRARLTYPQLRDTYRARLAAGAKAPGPYLPRVGSDQTALVARYRAGLGTLNSALSRWPDSDLDDWQARHPILGDLTVRELLYFTVYHNRHHRNGVQATLRGDAATATGAG
ncbi:DinB family protein [uncultured Deinococcus sp.]|uniref:DinB family protein n=1 Tax=uncultured Deinococcus sp. TaxID=158789 RepID=UPI0025EBC389|nr:DinB family protein [uncultured Deinococcus sp.]